MDGGRRRAKEPLHLVLRGRGPMKLEVLADEVQVRTLLRRGLRHDYSTPV